MTTQPRFLHPSLALLLAALSCAAEQTPDEAPASGEPVVEETKEPAFGFATGLDVLADGDGAALDGRRVALLTNDAARDVAGLPAWEILADLEGVELVRLYTPEHGLGADAHGAVSDDVEPVTGLEIVSLYGGRRAPEPAELAGLDALVYDLPDVGVRFYTYTSTLYLCLEACREAGIPLVVLDRPCPPGDGVAGPLPTGLGDNFVGLVPLPVLYGMTPGETARWIAGELLPGVVVEVVPLNGYKPGAVFDEQSPPPPWRATSPNLPRLSGVLLYPGLGLFEPTALSVGRGTDSPFEVLGAPWLDAAALADHWTEHVPGARFETTTFTPSAPSDGRHDGATCQGVRVVVEDREAFEPLGLALWGYDFLGRRHPARTALKPRFLRRMLGVDDLQRVFDGEADSVVIWTAWLEDTAAFESRREPYLLYGNAD
ncbi:MAG: DUF1343 domain-containing protein [Candidatus Coatesbacteria bacterium]|nr:DUF1343 domain-containing protein [Candidatus Coatesbacteria bacterium]